MTTITVKKVEGKTNRKGVKQNKVYTIVSESSVKGFFKAIDSKGNIFSIWNCNGDWTKIGISKTNKRRYSYTTNFELNNQINPN